MTATIITSIYDDYDTLKPVCPQDVETHWVCVTGDADLYCPGWATAYRPSNLHPNLAAKRAKMRPWEFIRGPVIWLDASFRVTSPQFVRDMLTLVKDNPIAQFAHPWRDCIYEEAEESAKLPKYEGQPVLEQVAHYRDFNHPEHWGLWATGVVVRQHTDQMVMVGEHWHDECLRWTYQDQLSEAPVLRMHDLRPTSIPGDYFSSPWLSYEGSGRH